MFVGCSLMFLKWYFRGQCFVSIFGLLGYFLIIFLEFLACFSGFERPCFVFLAFLKGPLGLLGHLLVFGDLEVLPLEPIVFFRLRENEVKTVFFQETLQLVGFPGFAFLVIFYFQPY